MLSIQSYLLAKNGTQTTMLRKPTHLRKWASEADKQRRPPSVSEEGAGERASWRNTQHMHAYAALWLGEDGSDGKDKPSRELAQTTLRPAPSDRLKTLSNACLEWKTGFGGMIDITFRQQGPLW